MCDINIVMSFSERREIKPAKIKTVLLYCIIQGSSLNFTSDVKGISVN